MKPGFNARLIMLDEARRKLRAAHFALHARRRRQALEHMTIALDYMRRAAHTLRDR